MALRALVCGMMLISAGEVPDTVRRKSVTIWTPPPVEILDLIYEQFSSQPELRRRIDDIKRVYISRQERQRKLTEDAKNAEAEDLKLIDERQAQEWQAVANAVIKVKKHFKELPPLEPNIHDRRY